MNKKECEELIPMGVQLYRSILDPEVNPEIIVLSGDESSETIQGYFEQAGIDYHGEAVVLGMALRSSKASVALICADGVQTPFQFLQVMWHEMGHCTYRRVNPKPDNGVSGVCEQKMLCGVIDKFWDEVVAQSASNKVIQSLSEDLRRTLCPDYQEQSVRERHMLGFFLRQGIQGQNAASQVDDPLLKLMGVPFDPYALAIYSAETATNAMLNSEDAITLGLEECPRFDQALDDLVAMVGEQFGQKEFYRVSDEVFDATYGAMVKVAAALGAKEETLALMNASLKDMARILL